MNPNETYALEQAPIAAMSEEQAEAHLEFLVMMGVLDKFLDPSTDQMRYFSVVEEM